MRIRKKDRQPRPKRGWRLPYDPAGPFNDRGDRESMLSHAYTFGACLAMPDLYPVLNSLADRTKEER